MNFVCELNNSELNYFNMAKEVLKTYGLDFTNLYYFGNVNSGTVNFRKVKKNFFITYVNYKYSYDNNEYVKFYSSFKDAIIGIFDYNPHLIINKDKITSYKKMELLMDTKNKIILELEKLDYEQDTLKKICGSKYNEREVMYLKNVEKVYNSFGILGDNYSFYGEVEDCFCLKKLGNKFYMTFAFKNGIFSSVKFYNSLEMAVNNMTFNLASSEKNEKILKKKILQIKR